MSLFGATIRRISSCPIIGSRVIIIIGSRIIIIITVRTIIGPIPITNSRIRAIPNSRIRRNTKSGTIMGIVVTVWAVRTRCIITSTSNCNCYWRGYYYNGDYYNPKAIEIMLRIKAPWALRWAPSTSPRISASRACIHVVNNNYYCKKIFR